VRQDIPEKTMNELPNMTELEKRVRVLEERAGLTGGGIPGAPSLRPAWPFALGVAAIALGYLGLGYPQHYYQILFSILLLLLFYHRGFLVVARGRWKWPQILVNFLLLCLLFKLLIGGGISHPLDWFKLPAITKAPPSGGQSWYSGVVPDYTMQWQAIPALAQWSIDVTKIQTFLLLMIFAGALFRFEPFTSITALALIVISLPTYLRFNWDWVVLFIIAGSVSIYLQARMSLPTHRS
jgi:hypothetical protein